MGLQKGDPGQELNIDTGFPGYIPFWDEVIVVPLIDQTYLTIDGSVSWWFALTLV